MRIVVTGKNGQMAQALKSVGSQRELVFLGRPELDFENPDSLRQPIRRARPDLIINCAAMTQVDDCEADGDRAFAINAVAPHVIASVADELQVPIIQLSTDYVFDGTLRRRYEETDLPNPLNIYGRSKLEGEAAVRAETRRHAVVRVSWVYSQYSNNFLSAMMKLPNTRKEICVVDDQVSCPTPGVELASALLALADGLIAKEIYGVFHLAGADPIDRASLAEAVMSWLREEGRPSARILRLPSSEFTTPAVRPLYSALNSEKVASTYGIKLPSWQSWLPDCLRAISLSA